MISLVMMMGNSSSPRSQGWIAALFLCGILILVWGLADIAFISPPSGNTLSNTLISMGTVLVTISGLRLWRGESYYRQDERTRRIGAFSLSWSWFFTLLILLVVLWADRLRLWSPDAGTLSVLLILLMGISAGAFRTYLLRRGDVD